MRTLEILDIKPTINVLREMGIHCTNICSVDKEGEVKESRLNIFNAPEELTFTEEACTSQQMGDYNV